MFRKWLEENKIEDFDFSIKPFPVASDRSFWDLKYCEAMVQEAEKYINYEWPMIKATDWMAFKQIGNRRVHEIPYGYRRGVLASLFYGELLEYKKRFLPDLVNGLLTVCEETYWGGSAHSPYTTSGKVDWYLPTTDSGYVDIWGGETARLLSTIHYVLYDELNEYCPDILNRIEQELDRRIVKPYLEHTDAWYMGYDGKKVNNWNPWCLTNILSVFLLNVKDSSIKHKGIYKAVFEIQSIYDSFPNDGGCDEGFTYWNVSGGKLFDFCEQLYIATNGKINFFNDEKIKKIGRYPCSTYIGNNRVVNFADGSSRVSSLSTLFYRFGKRIGDKELASLSSESPDLNENIRKRHIGRQTYNDEMFSLIYADEVKKLDSFIPKTVNILPDLQIAINREKEWLYAIKGGNNKESHNHNDVGSFIIAYDKEPIIVDAGCELYTKKTFSADRYSIWTMQSGWHNLPVINNIEQKNGPEFKADFFESLNKHSTVSFASAYPSKAEIEKLLREINIFNEEIEIKDTFIFKTEKNTVCETLITPFNVTVKDDKVIIDEKFVVETNIPSVISVDRKDFCGDTNMKFSWKTEGMNRIRFNFELSKTAEIKFTVRRMK